MTPIHKAIATLILVPAALSAGAASTDTLRLSHGQCVEMAVSHSQSIKRAQNAASQAGLDREIANRAILPKLDASGTALYLTPDIDMGGQKLQMRGAYVAGLQLIQPIYTGGKISAGKKLAAIGHDVAGEQLRMSRADVIANASDAYWTYIAVGSKVKMLEHYVVMMDSLMNQITTAVEAGMTTNNELLRINSKRSTLQYQLQKANSGLSLCRMALCNWIGADETTMILTVDSLPECTLPESLVSDVTNRPELRLLQYQVQAAEQQIRMARADYLPTVALSLGYNYYGNIKMKGIADVGGGVMVPFSQEMRDGMGMGLLSVKIPLWSWGEGNRKVKKSRLALENAQLDLDEKRRLLTLEATQATSNVVDGLTMVQTAQLSLQENNENLRVMQNRYNEGMATLSDLLEAQSQWQEAHSNNIEAITQHQINLTAWRKATGQL